MLGSAAGGGALTAFTVIGKFWAKWAHFAPFIDGLFAAADYAGSFLIMQFVGFTLACLAVQGSWRSPAVPTSVIIPLLVLAYPLFDTTLVVVLRLRQGRSPFVGGKDHSSHRLVRLGLGRVETVLLIYLFAVSQALTALLVSSVTLRLSLLALAGSVSVLFIFGMVLRKAPSWETATPDEDSTRG